MFANIFFSTPNIFFSIKHRDGNILPTFLLNKFRYSNLGSLFFNIANFWGIYKFWSYVSRFNFLFFDYANFREYRAHLESGSSFFYVFKSFILKSSISTFMPKLGLKTNRLILDANIDFRPIGFDRFQSGFYLFLSILRFFLAHYSYCFSVLSSKRFFFLNDFLPDKIRFLSILEHYIFPLTVQSINFLPINTLWFSVFSPISPGYLLSFLFFLFFKLSSFNTLNFFDRQDSQPAISIFKTIVTVIDSFSFFSFVHIFLFFYGVLVNSNFFYLFLFRFMVSSSKKHGSVFFLSVYFSFLSSQNPNANFLNFWRPNMVVSSIFFSVHFLRKHSHKFFDNDSWSLIDRSNLSFNSPFILSDFYLEVFRSGQLNLSFSQKFKLFPILGNNLSGLPSSEFQYPPFLNPTLISINDMDYRKLNPDVYTSSMVNTNFRFVSNVLQRNLFYNPSWSKFIFYKTFFSLFFLFVFMKNFNWMTFKDFNRYIKFSGFFINASWTTSLSLFFFIKLVSFIKISAFFFVSIFFLRTFIGRRDSVFFYLQDFFFLNTPLDFVVMQSDIISTSLSVCGKSAPKVFFAKLSRFDSLSMPL